MTTPDVRSWLAARFRERREWWVDDLYARLPTAVPWGDVWAASMELPILKRLKFYEADGLRHWIWVAEDGWPESEEAAS